MANIRDGSAKGKRIDVGIDVHKSSWSVCILCEGEQIYQATLPPEPERLISLLKRLQAQEVHTVYEAGPTGYWLHDSLVQAGFDSIVTPPSLVPHVGGRVKTDQRDSRKLTAMLSNGFLRRVHVLSPEERADRQLLRTRNQIDLDRRRVMSQIKSLLLMHGYRPTDCERWTRAYVSGLENLSLPFDSLKIALDAQLTHYRYLEEQVKTATNHLLRLAECDRYRDRVAVLIAIPGIGIFTAMAILIELQDIERFRRADQLASYLGLTPSQHSSGDRLHHGRITCCGNALVRTRLVESSWTLIRYDENARATFERIKRHTGSSKKAITAIARRLALRIRRVLLDQRTVRAVAQSPSAPVVKTARPVRRYVLKHA